MPDSADAVNFMKRCLKECDNNHASCTARGPETSLYPKFPTRLIEINRETMNVRIVDGSEKVGKYVAFSHRWVSESEPLWVTKQSNLAQRHSWFSAQNLPTSLKDVIKVVGLLGLKYVWIDSICIIQDSPADWNKEASRMADIYANAYVTIFADIAKDDNHSFLTPRETFPSTSVTIQGKPGIPIKIQLLGRQSDWVDFKEEVFTSDTRRRSYVSNRAWVLQELLLSRRKLHFGAHQIYWVCTQHHLERTAAMRDLMPG